MLNLKKYKHLFFDLDNTILDFDFASKMAFQSLLKLHFKDSELAYDIYKKVNKEIWEAFEKKEITSDELRAKRFDIFLAKMEWSGKGKLWNKEYLAFLIQHIKFIPGVKEILNKAYNNHNVHIVTNGLKEVQRPRIELAGLTNLVSSITVSDEIGAAKPQMEFFNTAFENANSPKKKDSLMIGDNYNSDIIGAHNFGINSCWYNRTGIIQKENIHTYEFSNMQEILI